MDSNDNGAVKLGIEDITTSIFYVSSPEDVTSMFESDSGNSGVRPFGNEDVSSFVSECDDDGRFQAVKRAPQVKDLGLKLIPSMKVEEIRFRANSAHVKDVERLSWKSRLTQASI